MPRKLKSPVRTISNAGEYPRFIGLLTSPKTRSAGRTIGRAPLASGISPYDSLSSLACAIYLEWRSDVNEFRFEPKLHEFPADTEIQGVSCIPDYEAIMKTGEVAMFEAKYSQEQLRPEEREKIKLAKSHFERRGISYEVVYRLNLEQNGFLDNLYLLRQYGRLHLNEVNLLNAERLLKNHAVADLATWRKRASKAGVSTAMLYHLLYKQRLPLLYRPMQFVELSKWHD